MGKPSHGRRKVDVQQNQIGSFLARGGNRLGTVQGGNDLKTSALQFQGNCLEDDFVVINHQDFLLARWGGFGVHNFTIKQRFASF